MKKIIFPAVMMVSIVLALTSCKKESVSNTPSGAPRSQIPAPFTGNWSSSSVGLTTYWNQGSYDGSYGNTVKTIVLKGDGTAEDYGYYEGAYSSVFFYRYTCTATYEKEGDGSVTITEYPFGGEQIIGSGPKKPIASTNFYPNNKFIMKKCEVVEEGGEIYLKYFNVSNGTVSTTPSFLKKL
jgi:hypothetical protein